MESRADRDLPGTPRALHHEFKADNPVGRKGVRPARVISITSGKGGVGKTVCVANLAMVMARQGYRVLVIDADLGLANIDLYFGLNPQFNLNHFFAGEKELQDIFIPAADRITVLPAGSGIQKYTHLDSSHKVNLMEGLEALHDQFDVVLIDTEAGISENVTYFNVAAQEIVVITTPEPTAISDAYALMKLLSTRYYEKQFNLVVNSVVSENEALDVYHKLTLVSSRFSDFSIDFLGAIPLDKRFSDSVRRQRPFVELFPESRPSTAFTELVETINLKTEMQVPKGSQQFFWKRLLSSNETP